VKVRIFRTADTGENNQPGSGAGRLCRYYTMLPPMYRPSSLSGVFQVPEQKIAILFIRNEIMMFDKVKIIRKT
jgi:hypothetical protein